MDNQEKEKLKQEYQNMSDMEIIELASTNKGEYENGVYEIVLEEYRKRDLHRKVTEKEKPQRSHQESLSYTSSYRTIRSIAKFAAFIGWLTLSISILVFLVSTQKEGIGWIGLLSAFIMFAIGLNMVVVGQITRAIVDNTDNTGEILSVLKKIADKQ